MRSMTMRRIPQPVCAGYWGNMAFYNYNCFFVLCLQDFFDLKIIWLFSESSLIVYLFIEDVKLLMSSRR